MPCYWLWSFAVKPPTCERGANGVITKWQVSPRLLMPLWADAIEHRGMLIGCQQGGATSSTLLLHCQGV
ncbi:hypothetical protein TU84_20540 [Pseudomonas helleri]|nr:hypothetical protein TU84_20540 [Pseudomonas helleri]